MTHASATDVHIPRSKASRRGLWVVWLLSTIGFVILRTAWLEVSWGDEAIYLYQGRLLTEGMLPYRDFFLAHPPLRIVLAAISELLLDGPALAKSICLAASPIAALLTGLAAFSLAPRMALLVPPLLLFGGHHLLIAGSYIGANLTMLLVAGALYTATHSRWFISGLILGLSALQGLYSGIYLPGLALLAAKSRSFRPWSLGVLIGGVPLLLIFVGIGAPAVDQMLSYHLHKAAATTEWPLGALLAAAITDGLPLSLAVFGVILGRGHARYFAIGGLLAWALVGTYASLVRYYFLIPLPALLLSAAVGAEALLDRMLDDRRAILSGVLVLVSVVSVTPPVLDAWDANTLREHEVTELHALAKAVSLRLPAESPLLGDGAFVPAIALNAKLRIAGGQIDTNAKRFETNPNSLVKLLRTARSTGASLLLADHHGISRLPEVTRLVQQERSRALGFWYGTGSFRLALYTPQAAPDSMRSLPTSALGCTATSIGGMIRAALAPLDLERPLACLANTSEASRLLIWLRILQRLPGDTSEAQHTLTYLRATPPEMFETPQDAVARLNNPEWQLEAHSALFAHTLAALKRPDTKSTVMDALERISPGPPGCPTPLKVRNDALRAWKGFSTAIGTWRTLERTGPRILTSRFPTKGLCQLGALLVSPIPR